MYKPTITQLAKTLEALDRCLEKGIALAEEKKFAPEVLLAARFAPDMYPLTRQVQAACDAAKFAAARVSGKDAPKHPDTETTMAELRTRIASVVSYLKGFEESDFAGAATRVVPLGFMPGKGLLADDYLTQMVVPNFYFHVVTAYDLLRHNGVAVGKADFISSLPLVAT